MNHKYIYESPEWRNRFIKENIWIIIKKIVIIKNGIKVQELYVIQSENNFLENIFKYIQNNK